MGCRRRTAARERMSPPKKRNSILIKEAWQGRSFASSLRNGVAVAVIGAGPAGATAARLLADWGHSVAILARPPDRHSLAESLPPSIRKLLDHVGILKLVENAGFLPATGNTSWWGDGRGRSESFSDATGFQVLRADFDGLLLEAAAASGAARRAVTVGRIDLEGPKSALVEYVKANGTRGRFRARFVLDCSGRAGVIARRFRVKDRRLTTVALSGVWRREGGFTPAEATHTLVEAYADGWAWSVPLSKERRHVAFMVDPRPGTAARYHTELAKTAHLKRILEGGSLEQSPWTCDASVYGARAFGGPRFLLVGDAGSFLDPMSSFGVKKALASAWMAAVVANTCLRRPERTDAALALFTQREREMSATYARESARYIREAALRYASPFWTRRAEAALPDGVDPEADPAVRAAFHQLRRRRRLQLRLGPGVSDTRVPEIQGREVVLAEAALSPGLPQGVRHVRGVLVPSLLQLAPAHASIPNLYEAYNRVAASVALPDFLGALSFLIAKGLLDTDEASQA